MEGVKVFLYTLLRTVVFVGVALAVWYFFGWNRLGVIGAVLSIVVGGVVAFAVGYLFFDRTRREAARSVEERAAARRANKPGKVTKADEDAAEEDALQDQERNAAGLGAEDRKPTDIADDEA